MEKNWFKQKQTSKFFDACSEFKFFDFLNSSRILFVKYPLSE